MAKNIDWDALHRECAMRILQAQLSRVGTSTEKKWHKLQVETSIQLADEYIKQMKERYEGEEENGSN